MGLFFKISDKKLLEIRNEIFVKKGIPELEKNGFKKSPFSTSWYGRNNKYKQFGEGSFGQPRELESWMPVWRSGRSAVDHFQNGNY